MPRRAAQGEAQRSEIRPLIEPNGERMTLSELDRSLIRLLQRDGRRSFVALARELGVTEKTVRRHVDALQSSNTVQISAIAAPELLGHLTAAIVGVRLGGAARAADVAATLIGHPRIDYVVVATGRFDLLVEVVASGEAQLAETVERGIKAQPGVVTCELFPYLWVHHQQFDWSAAHRREPVGDPRLVSPPDVDAVDLQIVAELAVDGRMPLGQVSRRVGVSESLVRKRLNRLLEADAMRVTAITHPSIVGLNVAWIGLCVTPPVKLTEAAAALVERNAFTYIVVCGGGFDLLVEVVYADKRELLTILDDEIRSVPGLASAELFTCADMQFKPVRPRP